MVKVNNKNDSLEILKDFGFKRKIEWGNSGNYRYHIYNNSKLEITFVYNCMIDSDYIEVWFGKYMDNHDTMEGIPNDINAVLQIVKNHLSITI